MIFSGDVKPQQDLIEAGTQFSEGKELTFQQVALLARHACTTGDMAFYIRLFSQIEPRLRRHFQKNCQQAEFLGDTGRVFGNVNIFRKVQYRSLCGPVLAFEKIYRRNSADLKRLQWVYRTFWGKLPCQMPRIIEINQGRRFSVVLFEFEAFDPVSPDALIEILLQMNAFSIAHPASGFDTLEATMLEMPQLYQRRMRNLAANLAMAGVPRTDLPAIQAACMDTVHVFNHADLHRFNVGQNGMIYDWDCACFAPAAHDLGRAAASLREFRRLAGLRDFIQDRLGRDMTKDRADVARIMFFYLVYAAKKKLSPQDDAALITLRAMFTAVQRDLT